MKVDFSNFLRLNLTDLLRGLIMAVIGAVLTTVYSVINDPSIDWNLVWKAAAGAAVSYLLKNLFTNPPSTVVVDHSKTEIEYK